MSVESAAPEPAQDDRADLRVQLRLDFNTAAVEWLGKAIEALLAGKSARARACLDVARTARACARRVPLKES